MSDAPTQENEQAALVTAPSPAIAAQIAHDFGGAEEWIEAAKKQVLYLQKNDLLPSKMTPGQALAVLRRGKAMEITPDEALAVFYPYQGKLGTYAQGALMLAQKKGAVVEWTPGKTGQPEAEVTIVSPKGDRGTFSYSMEDATRAKLANKPGAWQSSPQDMLCNRALMRGLRFTFPLLLGSAYLADEIDEMERPETQPSDAGSPEATLRPPTTIGTEIATALLARAQEAGKRKEFTTWIARQFPGVPLDKAPAARYADVDAWLNTNAGGDVQEAEFTVETPRPAEVIAAENAATDGGAMYEHEDGGAGSEDPFPDPAEGETPMDAIRRQNAEKAPANREPMTPEEQGALGESLFG
jgi:hypothetical protein